MQGLLRRLPCVGLFQAGVRCTLDGRRVRSVHVYKWHTNGWYVHAFTVRERFTYERPNMIELSVCYRTSILQHKRTKCARGFSALRQHALDPIAQARGLRAWFTQQNMRVEEVTMTSIPAITEQAIRSFAGEQNFQNGQQYFHDGAIVGAVRQSMTLKAYCYGSLPEPYRVQVTFGVI